MVTSQAVLTPSTSTPRPTPTINPREFSTYWGKTVATRWPQTSPDWVTALITTAPKGSSIKRAIANTARVQPEGRDCRTFPNLD
jgi:hypothetical protein